MATINGIQSAQVQLKPIEIMAQSNQTNQGNEQNTGHQQAAQVSAGSLMTRMQQEPNYQPTMQEEVVIKAIEAANQKVNGGPREFAFSIHEKTKEIMVKVVDATTKEVIREIPPEKVLDMVAERLEAAGLFVDEKR